MSFQIYYLRVRGSGQDLLVGRGARSEQDVNEIPFVPSDGHGLGRVWRRLQNNWSAISREGTREKEVFEDLFARLYQDLFPNTQGNEEERAWLKENLLPLWGDAPFNPRTLEDLSKEVMATLWLSPSLEWPKSYKLSTTLFENTTPPEVFEAFRVVSKEDLPVPKAVRKALLTRAELGHSFWTESDITDKRPDISVHGYYKRLQDKLGLPVLKEFTYNKESTQEMINEAIYQMKSLSEHEMMLCAHSTLAQKMSEVLAHRMIQEHGSAKRAVQALLGKDKSWNFSSISYAVLIEALNTYHTQKHLSGVTPQSVLAKMLGD